MVKYLSMLTVLLILGACENDKNSFTSHNEFDSSAYSLVGYSDRVEKFLKSRSETAGLSSYQAVFVNTEGCSACTRGSLSDIAVFLSKPEKETFIYANDSSLHALISHHKMNHFLCLSKQEFEKRNIFHTEMYLYTVKNQEINSIYLNMKNRDSLNAL